MISVSAFRLSSLMGCLWHSGNRLYVPDQGSLRHDILYWHHDVPWMAHLGAQRSISMVQAQFYWPGMKSRHRGVYQLVCEMSVYISPDRRRNVPSLSPLVPPSSCWRTIGVDLVVDLPRSADGHNAICVFVCHLSKMVRLVPCTTELDAQGFAKLFMREVFPHYGFPPLDCI